MMLVMSVLILGYILWNSYWYGIRAKKFHGATGLVLFYVVGIACMLINISSASIMAKNLIMQNEYFAWTAERGIEDIP
jgi:hypothetical protein